MSNRVEDLERQVAELRATVNGLTEELVELKERTRQVEEAKSAEAESVERDTQPAAAPIRDESSSESGTRTTHSDDHVDVVTQSGDPSRTANDETTSDDDIVVHEESASTPDAEAATAADESDESESGGNDIIIA